MLLSTELPTVTENRDHSRDCILKLRVNNHPGVMSHICGLFSRRGFNVEKILCLPLGNGKESTIFLALTVSRSSEQIIKQLSKLEDVLEVIQRESQENIFDRIEKVVGQQEL